MRITIDFPDYLLPRLQAEAERRGIETADLVLGFVREGVARFDATPEAPFPDFRELRRRTPPPVIPPAGRQIPRLTNEDLARLEEEDDLDRYRRSFPDSVQ